EWQPIFLDAVGRRVVQAADEYYLLSGRPFPNASTYEGFPMHEDGVGMARTLEQELSGLADEPTVLPSGFFAWVDGGRAAGYRARRVGAAGGAPGRDRAAPIAILTGEYGARVLAPLVATFGRDDVRLVPVRNEFFGGNIAVTGLLVGADLTRVLAAEPA